MLRSSLFRASPASCPQSLDIAGQWSGCLLPAVGQHAKKGSSSLRYKGSLWLAGFVTLRRQVVTETLATGLATAVRKSSNALCGSYNGKDGCDLSAGLEAVQAQSETL